jgi:predicted acyltransferase
MGGDSVLRNLAEASGSPFFNKVAFQFDHPAWNGFRLYDLIFPLFLFLAGVATPYSVGRQLEKGTPKSQLLLRVIKRGLVLVLLGILANTRGLQLIPVSEIRFGSVLGRIGLAYMFANIIYIYGKQRAQITWFFVCIIGYWLLLKFTSAPGFPAGDLTMEGNFASYVDRTIMPGRLYLKIHDPEGVMSTLPAISTALLGIMAGSLLKKGAMTESKKALYLFLAGIVSMIIAQIWNLDFPINKNLWTSSFVLHAGGISLILLSVFYYVIDVLNYRKWAFFFVVIGMNSILIYLSGILIDWGHATNGIFKWVGQAVGDPYGLVFMAICVLIVKWFFLYFLYRKKVFLRV